MDKSTSGKRKMECSNTCNKVNRKSKSLKRGVDTMPSSAMDDFLKQFTTPAKKFATRCSVTKLIRVNETLTEYELAILDELGFGTLARIRDCDEMNRDLLESIVHNYCPETSTMNLLNKKFQLDDYAVYEALGIPYEGDKIYHLTSIKSGPNLYGKLFRMKGIGVSKLDTTDLMSHLTETKNINNDKIFKIMYFTLLFGVFLYPCDQYDIPTHYLNLVEYIIETPKVNWASLVIEKINRKIHEWRSNAKTKFVGGCAYLLQVIYLGRVRTSGSKYSLDLSEEVPFIQHLSKLRSKSLCKELMSNGGYGNAMLTTFETTKVNSIESSISANSTKSNDNNDFEHQLYGGRTSHVYPYNSCTKSGPPHTRKVIPATEIAMTPSMLTSRITLLESSVSQLRKDMQAILSSNGTRD
ncbi:hypothetical protein ACP275_09G068500 [Erythranthe tilingii]